MIVLRRLTALTVLLPFAALAQSATFRGGSDHRGEYKEVGVPSVGGLQWRWQTLGPVRGSPTAVGQVVYVGSSDGSVYAIDVRSGEVKWRRDVDSPVVSTPAVDNALVIVGALRWHDAHLARC